jgi:hypothetical protein
MAAGSALGVAAGPTLAQAVLPSMAPVPLDDEALERDYIEALDYYSSGAWREDDSPETQSLIAAAGFAAGVLTP